MGPASSTKAIRCPRIEMNGMASTYGLRCLVHRLLSCHVHCARDSTSAMRFIKYFAECLVAHETMNLNSVNTQHIRKPQYLLGMLQVSHQHGRNIRWSGGDKLGRLLRYERILASMSDTTDETDGVGAGINGDSQVGFRANTADLDSRTSAHHRLSHPIPS